MKKAFSLINVCLPSAGKQRCFLAASSLRFVLIFVCLSLASLSSANTDKSPLTIAVASNFSATMHALVDDYRSVSDQPIRIVKASSGKLFAQIRHGAPFDLFFSADQQKPAALIHAKLAIDSSLQTYAQGRLVLWQPDIANNQNPTFVSAKTIDQLAQVSNSDKLAIANPKHAPYGQAAQALMHHLGVQQALTNQLVFGENVAQAFQFAERGAVPYALVALALVIKTIPAEQWWLVPSNMHPPILQDCVIIRRTQLLAQAQAFLDYLKTDSAQSILQQYGYSASIR